MCSASEQSQSPILRFVDFLDILRKRGQVEEASQIGMLVMFECLMRGRTNILNLTVEEALELCEIPPTPPGWDNFTWGGAVVK